MKLEQLTKLFKENYSGENYDEVIKNLDIKKVSEGVNLDANGLIDNKVKKATTEFEKNFDTKKPINDFLLKQGFKNEDEFAANVKNSKSTTTELQVKATRLETENKTLLDEKTTLNQTIEKNSNELFNSKITTLSLEIGVDQKLVGDFVKVFELGDVDKTNTDDIKAKLTSTLEEKPHFGNLNKDEKVQKEPTTFGGITKPENKNKKTQSKSSFKKGLESI